MHEVSQTLAERVEELAIALTGTAPRWRERTELRFRAKGSLSVVFTGDRKGQFFDHEAAIGGDALDLVRHLRCCDRREAWRWAIEWLGGRIEHSPAPAPAMRPARPKPDHTHIASRLWNEAGRAAGTLVEQYLASRNLLLPVGGVIRFHPACARGEEKLPAMLTLMTDPETAKPCGIHRTFLRPDGSGKAEGNAKMMLGAGGVMRLSADDEVTTGLGITEGIENALSLMQHAGWLPIWTAGSTSGIINLPILPGIESLTIFADADDGGAGLNAAKSCALRWASAGRDVRIIPPAGGRDWNDVVREAAA